MCFPQMFNLRFIRSPAAKASGGPIIERVFDKQWMQRPEDVLERTTHVQRPETLTARQFLKRAGVKDRAAAQTGVENDQAHARAAATDPELDSLLPITWMVVEQLQQGIRPLRKTRGGGAGSSGGGNFASRSAISFLKSSRSRSGSRSVSFLMWAASL